MYDNGLSYTKQSFKGRKRTPPLTNRSCVTQTSTDILNRPIKIASYTVDDTTYSMGTLSIFNLFSDPMIVAIIRNYIYYKCTGISYKVVVNAPPQSMGRVIIVSSPYDSSLGIGRSLTTVTTPQQLTTHPNAEIDFGSGESVTFTVPFVSPYPQLEFDSFASWSNVHLYMMNPFKGITTGDTATVSIFAFINDPELMIPGAQGDSDEMEEKTKHPISSAFSELSKFSDAISFLPVVGDFATGVSWISAVAAKAASAFGYSKPPNDSSTHFMSPMPARGYTHSEGSDDSVPMALRPSNAVSVSPSNFGVSIDPHSYVNFLTREQLIEITQYNVGDPIDTILFDYTLRADDFSQSLYRAVSDSFELVNASLVFRLSAVKNVFYSGRLIIEFVRGNSSTVTWNPANPSILFDLKTNKEIVFRVPYLDQSRVRPPSQSGGKIIVRVLNPLFTNDTYPQSIDLNLYMAVSRDVLFGAPAHPTLVYAAGLADEECVECVPNSLEEHAISLIPTDNVSPNDFLFVCGETTFSISDLLKRFNYDYTAVGFSFLTDPGDFSRWETSNHPLQRWSAFYRYYRGSFRYKIFMRQPPSTPAGLPDLHCSILAALTYDAQHYTSPVSVAITPFSNRPEARVAYHINNVLEVTVPYYTSVDVSIVGSSVNFGALVPLLNFWCLVSHPQYTVPPVWDVYLAAGDDFSFGYPLSLIHI